MKFAIPKKLATATDLILPEPRFSKWLSQQKNESRFPVSYLPPILKAGYVGTALGF